MEINLESIRNASRQPLANILTGSDARKNSGSPTDTQGTTH